MSKIALTDPASISDSEEFLSTIAANNVLVEDAIENTLSRDGTTPNEMTADLDMNGNAILNLPEPVTSTEPATKHYVDSVSALSTSAALTAAVTAAGASATAAAASATAASTTVTGYTATSVTDIIPSIASKAFTIAAGKSFVAGDWVLIRSAAAPTTVYMHGPVTAYVTTTLTVDVQTIGTATESADWTITVSSPRGPTGATGTAGAAGTDFTSDAELLGLSTLTATAGLLTQTADNVFTTRQVAGTANRVTVTNPAGVAGNVTLNTGTDVMHRNVTADVTVGFTQTPYDHGTLTGTTGITPLPSLGSLQKASLAAASVITITAPTAEQGNCILQLTNTGAPTSVTFASFDKQFLGATFSLTINKVHWVYITSIGTIQVMTLQNVV